MAVVLFYSYSHKDEDLRDELDKHLSLLQRRGLVTGWHDRRIGAGGEWRDEIDAHARTADIILLLISADLIASEYCYGVEMKLALERHASGEAIVIPVILRPVDWSGAPFAHLQALPRDAKPLTTWLNRDEGFTNVAQAIRDVVVRRRPAQEPSNRISAADVDIPRSRMLDAAIPSHIVKDRPTELLVLIRLPDSPGLVGILLDDETAEARPEDVLSRPFSLAFPVGLDGKPGPLKATVKLTAPDFAPPEQAKNLFVPVDADSEVCPFILTPLRIGRLKILVELQWEDALRGHRRLLTECVAEAANASLSSAMNVVRLPVGFEGDNATKASSSASVTVAYNKDVPFTQVLSRGSQGPEPARGKPSAPIYTAGPAKPNGHGTATVRKKLLNSTQIVVVVIGAMSAILGGYWQYHKPDLQATPPPSQSEIPRLVFTGNVLNAETKASVPDALVSVVLDSNGSPLETHADSNGNFTINVGSAKRSQAARLFVRAPGFEPLEKNFEIPDSFANGEFLLRPMRGGTVPQVPRSEPVQQVRSVSSGQVNFGCDQSIPVETPVLSLGKNPRNIEAQANWTNTDNVKTQNQSVAYVKDPVDHHVIGIKAMGSIAGRDSQSILGIKNCPGGGHGELILHARWTQDE